MKDTLIDVGIPSKLVDVVWHCISSPVMKILWNGESTDPFTPSRGVRQGDPLSPYIFVLCIERLSQLISLLVDQGVWKPIKLNRNDPPLSHLCFAGDLILFGEASLSQAHVIQQCLEVFCSSSGQRVSNDKTHIFFSKNVHKTRREEISDVLGFSRTMDLGKYLGVPLHHKRVTRNTYQFLLDKSNKRLSGWKSKSLSLSGRLTLTQSVLAALPAYVMQTSSIPRQICHELDRKCRNFV